MSRGVTIATAFALVLSICLLGGASPASAKKRGCASTSVVPSAKTLPQAQDAVLCLINQQRARRGLRSLRASAPLTQAAFAHSADMVARQYFAHVSLEGETVRQRVLRTGYFAGNGGGAVEEALACGWMRLATPKSLVTMLMRSSAHQAILLNRGLRDVGIGLALGGPQNVGSSGGATLTLNLARR
jgi:uncharacterized protein YkwD